MRRIGLARFLQRVTDFLPRRFPVGHAVRQVEPFFIFGSGRNGSTLLNRMLNQHTGLFLPSEQYFLGNSIIKFKLYNFLIWRDLMKVIAGELVREVGSHTWDFDAGEVLNDLIYLPDKSLREVIEVIYRKYGSKYKGNDFLWGDSTPLNTYYLPEIFDTFPRAKYIFLIRDGRDVIASYKQAGKEYLGRLADPKECAGHWQHSIGKYEWLNKKTDVLVVKYEELVSLPEENLRRICLFLGKEYDAQMLEFHQEESSIPMYREPQHRNLGKPVFTDSVGRWEQVLSPEDKEVIRRIVPGLTRFEYL